MKNLLICFIGTGNYLNFLPNYYESVTNNFCSDCNKTILVFTDGDIDDTPDDVVVRKVEHKPWPYVTLQRFGMIKDAEDEILKHDWFVFMDADTIVNQTIEYDEFFDEEKDFIGVHHPCHYMKLPPHNTRYGSFDRTNSRAKVSDEDDLSTYWQGCLWGGRSSEIMSLITELDNRIESDLKDDIIALWHDESHLNKFFIENKDRVNTLSPSFAYPEDFDSQCKKLFDPKIVHISKNNSKYHT